MKTFLRRVLPIFGLVIWVTVAGLGLARLAQYESRAGAQAPSPESWPHDSRLPRATEGATLLMFVHPHCPCSGASLAELATVARQAGDGTRICVVFYRPSGVEEGWEKTDLWEQSHAIPDVVTVCDSDEIERKRFGVLTSGQALLYDAQGTLRFRGGLTRARGVAGEGPSRTLLLAALNGQGDSVQRPVFGCPLVSGDGDGFQPSQDPRCPAP